MRYKRERDATYVTSQLIGWRAKTQTCNRKDSSQLIPSTRRRYNKERHQTLITHRGESTPPSIELFLLINKQSDDYYTVPRNRRGLHLG